MHELSIAMSLIETATLEAERQAADRVLAIHLRIGRLSGVVAAALTSAFELAREGSMLETCVLRIEEVPVTIECPRCGVETAARSDQELRCAVCGEWAADIVHGRELDVVALEVQP